MNKDFNTSNWTGRTHRTVNEAFGPYQSASYHSARGRVEHPLATVLTGAGLAACWFVAFWLFGA